MKFKKFYSQFREYINNFFFQVFQANDFLTDFTVIIITVFFITRVQVFSYI